MKRLKKTTEINGKKAIYLEVANNNELESIKEVCNQDDRIVVVKFTGNAKDLFIVAKNYFTSITRFGELFATASGIEYDTRDSAIKATIASL